MRMIALESQDGKDFLRGSTQKNQNSANSLFELNQRAGYELIGGGIDSQ